MAKKRRITVDQARLLAITYIQQALANEVEFGSQIIPDDTRQELFYFRQHLPEKWLDGNTSDKSWDQVWEAMTVELMTILKGLDREAVRVKVENPEFRYTVQYPLSTPNGVAPGVS